MRDSVSKNKVKNNHGRQPTSTSGLSPHPQQAHTYTGIHTQTHEHIHKHTHIHSHTCIHKVKMKIYLMGALYDSEVRVNSHVTIGHPEL